MTAEGKALKEQYQWEARSQWKGAPFAVPLTVEITFHFGTRRKHDIDNFTKLVLDALTGIVWKDDVLIEELRLQKGYDKERPRVELNVRPRLTDHASSTTTSSSAS